MIQTVLAKGEPTKADARGPVPCKSAPDPDCIAFFPIGSEGSDRVPASRAEAQILGGPGATQLS